MSEPMKNPEGQPAPLPQEPSNASLIERAVRAFDKGQFVPPSSPSDMVPQGLAGQPMPGPQSPPVDRRRSAPQAPQGLQAPPAPQPQGYAPQPGYAPAPQGYAPQVPPAGTQQPWQAAPAAAPAPQAWEGPVAPPAYAAGNAPQAQRAFHRVNRQNLHERGMILPEGGASAQLEEFRIVKRRLIEQADDLYRRGGGAAARRVMVTSAHAGEGKTFCAVNLALSMAAEKDIDVVLVDLDLARASVLQTLGLPGSIGLMDAIADPKLDVRDLLMTTDVPGLSVLAGGRPTNSDAEYLASARGAAVLDLLTEGAPNRIVLFDTPPALAASLPVELAKLVGQGIMVVRADTTSGSAIQDAASLLAGCPNLQLLLNAVQFSPSGRRFGSYHGYRG